MKNIGYIEKKNTISYDGMPMHKQFKKENGYAIITGDFQLSFSGTTISAEITYKYGVGTRTAYISLGNKHDLLEKLIKKEHEVNEKGEVRGYMILRKSFGKFTSHLYFSMKDMREHNPHSKFCMFNGLKEIIKDVKEKREA